jgi:hypothetical protein
MQSNLPQKGSQGVAPQWVSISICGEFESKLLYVKKTIKKIKPFT